MDFEAIYQNYFQDVYLYLRSLAAREDLAEELAQETFFKALKAIDSFDGRKDIRAWLFTIAKHTYFTHCKRRKRDGGELSDALPDPQGAFLEVLMDQETAFLVHRFLHTMAEPYKEVFTLRVFGELPFDKIALLFQKTPSWARVTYHRAKKQIVEYMEEIDHD